MRKSSKWFALGIIWLFVLITLVMIYKKPDLIEDGIDISIYSDAYTQEMESPVQLFWDCGDGFNGENVKNAVVHNKQISFRISEKSGSLANRYRFDPISNLNERSEIVIHDICINGKQLPLDAVYNSIDAFSQCNVEYQSGKIVIEVFGDDSNIYLNHDFAQMIWESYCGVTNKKLAAGLAALLTAIILSVICLGKKEKIDSFLSKKNNGALVVFFLIFSYVILYSMWRNVTIYYYDSLVYWTDGDYIFQNGKLNVLNFPETYRGYLLYFVIQIVKHIGRFFGNEYWGWRVYSDAIYSLLFSTIFPVIFSKRINSLAGAIRSTICGIVLLLIWGDYLQYPLSDLSACVLLCGEIVVLKTLCDRMDHSRGIRIVKCFFAGCLAYGTYNVRVVFGYAAMLAIVLFMVFSFRKHIKVRTMVLAFSIMLFGMGIIAIPQAMINQKYVGSLWPSVHTEQFYDYSHSIQLQQIYWGIEYQKYETYIGDEVGYPSKQIFFSDPTGLELIQRENLSIDTFSYGSWIKLVIKYPADMIAIYMRHLIGLITPAFSSTYIADIYASRWFISFLSIGVWLVAGVAMMYTSMDKEKVYSWGWIVTACLPCFLQMFGAPEFRFFITVNLMIFYYSFSIPDYRMIWEKIKGKRIRIAVILFILYGFWTLAYSSTLNSMNDRTTLIHDSRVRHEEYQNRPVE